MYKQVLSTLDDEDEGPTEFPDWLVGCQLEQNLDLKFQAFIVIMGGEERPLRWE